MWPRAFAEFSLRGSATIPRAFAPHLIIRMQYLFHCLVLLNYFETTTSNIARVPVIHHVSMSVVNYTSTTINATCNQCLCAMLLNLTMMSSFNCFPQNGTCEIFSSSLKTSALLLLNNSMSSTYFRSLPTDVIAGLTTATNLQSTSESRTRILLLRIVLFRCTRYSERDESDSSLKFLD